ADPAASVLTPQVPAERLYGSRLSAWPQLVLTLVVLRARRGGRTGSPSAPNPHCSLIHFVAVSHSRVAFQPHAIGLGSGPRRCRRSFAAEHTSTVAYGQVLEYRRRRKLT